MEQAAGIVLLLLAVALVIQLMRAGPDGVREWIRAKFLGQTAAGQRAARGGSLSGTGASSTAGTVGGSILHQFTQPPPGLPGADLWGALHR